jgi:hypothetical protein
MLFSARDLFSFVFAGETLLACRGHGIIPFSTLQRDMNAGNPDN